MITVKQLLEARTSTIVLAFGRLNPVTSGHAVLANAVITAAKKYNAHHIFFVSKSQDPKKNPLNVDQKVYYTKQAFKGLNVVGANDKIRTFIEAAKSVSGKYENLIMIAGSDRVEEFKTLLEKYNGKEFNFKNIQVISAGERDPDADSAAGMSATKMRQAAVDNNFAKFKMGCPSAMPPAVCRKMFDDVRAGMRLNDSSDIRESYINDEIFNIGDIVVHEETEKTITYKGSNYVVLSDGVKTWLTDIEPTGKIDEAVMVKQQDKVKAARIIAMALGYEEAESKNDPTVIVNTALRMVRNKNLNPEAKKILGRMLELARKMEITFDEKLIKEDVARADYKTTKSGRKYRSIVHLEASGAYTDDEEKEDHTLLLKGRNPGLDYKRIRKIMYKVHEDENDDLSDEELEKILSELSDDDIIEHGYDDHEFFDLDESEEVNEVLSRVERMKAKVRMRRTKSRRERGARIALKRRSSSPVIARRSRRLAIKAIKMRLARKPLDKLSVAEKERLEMRIARMKPAISRLAVKIMPRVRQLEKSRLEHSSTKD